MEKKRKSFINRIIEWGKLNLREFPWRNKKTLYSVLISEIFLQKTAAQQVNSIFPSFMRQFPTPHKLIETSEENLIEIIKPLGLYNRRSKVLKKLASQLIFEYSNKVPENYDNLINLFGVGKYIANAVLCFYYNQKVALVDSNIIRIFQRFFNLKSEKKYKETDPKIWDFARSLLPDRDYQIYNYALLDFGDLVCKPKKPLCKDCSLNIECYYLKTDKKNVNP